MDTPRRPLVIGIDVGGTNTDSVLIDLCLPGPNAVLSSHKAATTANVTSGVQTTLRCLLDRWGGSAEDVTALAVGTTHFINAIVERDSSRVEKVAVLRLAAHDFSTGTPPFCDWPAPLRRLVHGHSAVVPGGVNIDGKELAPVDPAAVREQAVIIRGKGLRNIVVAGIGSPEDDRWRQEETVRDLLARELCTGEDGDGYNIICSRAVAGKGLLARENAAILNASILNFARRTIRSLVAGMRRMGLTCPLYLTSNSGHLLSFSEAVRFPIRIFSSGATNSMRGAAFLAGEDVVQNGCIVVDIGGTTSDVGFLLKNGYPRLSKAFTDLAGVKVNLEMPSVESAGLGGGSILQINQGPEGAVMVGPESVGHNLTTEALCFGGKTATASDVAVSLGADIGQTHDVQLPEHVITKARARVKRILETYIDRIKLSPEPCTAILVGGGSILCPAELSGVGKIVFPKHAGVANAVGAAMAKIYGSAELVVEADGVEEGMATAMRRAVDEAAAKGGDPSGVLVLNEEDTWVPYGDGQRRLKVEVALPADHTKVYEEMVGSKDQGQIVDEQADDEVSHVETKKHETTAEDEEDDEATTLEDLESYRPRVLEDGRWMLSRLDVKFIGIGCYMLGSGGGGSPYGSSLLLWQFLSEGETISVIRPGDLKDDDILPPVAGVGTPEVGLERPGGLGVLHSLQEMARLKGISKFTQMLVTEVGGSNGIGTLVWGSSKYYNVPTVDGDLMGRAWPAFEMTSQYLHAESINEMLPVTMCSGTGKTHIIPAPQKDEKAAAMEIRRVCAAMGFVAGATGNPLTGSKARAVAIPNTLSLSWRLGRAVVRARLAASLSTVADAIIDASGGPQSARCLFRGKIRSVSSKITETAHSTGLVVMERLGDDEGWDPREEANGAGEKMEWCEVQMPFVNENLAVVGKDEEGKETVLATVPDLIFLINQDTGENIGCQEYRYGLKVLVMQMAPHPFWTSKRGLEVSGPNVFQLPYKYDSPLQYTRPKSVIDEFCPYQCAAGM